MPEFPLKKIVDVPYFAEKAESPPLQLADLCAYLIMRHLLRRSDSQEFFELIPLNSLGGLMIFVSR